MSTLRGSLCLAAALLVAAPLRAAPDQAGVRTRVNALLGSFRPVSAAEWQALGPDAAPALESVARDPHALPTWRARALAALGVILPSSAAPLVRQIASDPSVAPVLRAAAVDAAPAVLGREAVAFLAPLLRDGDRAVRRRSAEALAASGVSGCQIVVTEDHAHPGQQPLAAAAARCAERLQRSPDR